MRNSTLSIYRSEFAKWSETIRIGLINLMVYKTNFILMVVGPSVVFFFIKYNLWHAIYKMDGVEKIQGYDFKQMLAYQTWVMIVAFLGLGSNSMNIAEDIRLGKITSYLIYPFSFWKFHTAGFLAQQILQFFTAIIALIFVFSLGFIENISVIDLMFGFLFSTLVGFTWFAIQFICGVLAFWLEETWVLRAIVGVISSFLSGAIIPLEVYPTWLGNLLLYSPFPYLTFVPVKIFMGTYEGNIGFAFVYLLFWTIILGGIAAWTWHRGLKLYSAAGM